MRSAPAQTSAERRAACWRATRRITLLLLGIWLAVTFCVIFYARSLFQFTLFGWTFSYYMAAQGTLFIYVILVGAYAWIMQRLEARLDIDKDKDAGEN
jgi:putative solute:sodium symporter small subunit